MLKDTPLSEKCQQIKCKAEYGAPYNPTFAEADPWTVTLKYQGRQLTVPFYMGRGLEGREPDCEEVMGSLLMDDPADSTFEDWCSELGENPDSRKADALYRKCLQVGKRLRRFLGEDYEAFLYGDRN